MMPIWNRFFCVLLVEASFILNMPFSRPSLQFPLPCALIFPRSFISLVLLAFSGHSKRRFSLRAWEVNPMMEREK